MYTEKTDIGLKEGEHLRGNGYLEQRSTGKGRD